MRLCVFLRHHNLIVISLTYATKEVVFIFLVLMDDFIKGPNPMKMFWLSD